MTISTPVACAAALSVLLLRPAVAQADPITITSGTLAGHAFLTTTFLSDIQGEGFSFTGGMDAFKASVSTCNPCASPVVDLGATLQPFGPGGGTGVIDGVSYDLVFTEFASGMFSTPSVTLTELGSSLVQVPFSFNAVLNGYSEHAFDRPAGAVPLFSVQLVGRGNASASFVGRDEDGTRSFSVDPASLRYEFTAQPVPEPGTLFLVGGALGVLVVSRMRAARPPASRSRHRS